LVIVPAGAVVTALVLAALASASNNVNCSGTQSTNVSGNLTVPSNKTCIINPGVTIRGNVYVDSGATLKDNGAIISGGVQATSPKGIGLGGSSTAPGTISANVVISGLTGTGPGTVTPGSNYICNSVIRGNVTVQNSGSNAGPWIIGDIDEECTGGGNQMGSANVTVQGNANRVDISDNEKGNPPYSVGISGNLTVQDPHADVVESNFVSGNAKCQPSATKDGDGTANIVSGNNTGCG
jgi:hypothetical protein